MPMYGSKDRKTCCAVGLVYGSKGRKTCCAVGLVYGSKDRKTCCAVDLALQHALQQDLLCCALSRQLLFWLLK
eukprot:1145755-Pelagomonas_calceolata.AAC.1